MKASTSFRHFAIFLSLVTALPQVLRAHDCEWLMKYGIYDSDDKSSSTYTVEHFKTLLQRSSATTFKDFQRDASNFGFMIPVEGLTVGLNFGNTTAQSDFKSWKQQYLSTKTDDLLKNSSYDTHVKNVSGELMQAVRECLKNDAGLTASWTRMPDNLTFSVSVAYNPRNTDSAVIKSFDIYSTSQNPIVPPVQAQAQLMRSGEVIPKTGITINFSRQKASDPVVIAINTTEGNKNFLIEGSDSEEPNGALAARVAALEATLRNGGLYNMGSVEVTFNSQSEPNQWKIENANLNLNIGDIPYQPLKLSLGKTVRAAWYTPLNAVEVTSKCFFLDVRPTKDRSDIEVKALNHGDTAGFTLRVFYVTDR